jgi:hypothetical protein
VRTAMSWLASPAPGSRSRFRITGQVGLHCFPQTTVQNFLDNGI